ncbi:MAG: helix-turn-helix domain-containing protein [Chloroflexi bacterium]|nr:helix-turn-helix domain-containing protein [Chloroflexota bacterium]
MSMDFFSVVAFIIGLVFLFRGEFRIAERTVPRTQARTIAILLMAPLVIGFCTLSLLLDPTLIDLDDPMAAMDDPAVLQAATQAGIIQLGALVVAVSASVYLIYSLPRDSERSAPAQSSRPVPNMAAAPVPKTYPSIMTVSEAAEYLRVGEADIQALIDEGKLAAARTSSGYRIAKQVIDDYLAGDTER